MKFFEAAIDTETTLRTYKIHLLRFQKFCKVDDPDQILSFSDQKLQEKLEGFLFDLKDKVSPNSIPSIFAGIELFLSVNDKFLNFKKLKKLYPPKVKKSGTEGWTTEELQEVLRHAKSRRVRVIVLFLVASRCRVGALPELKMKDIVDMPNGAL